jgi:AcrR family transcriptional regulator
VTVDTRERILDVAERLYAERGLHGVSLRKIAAAAGQRNNAAVHYHFGGRDGLVHAVFERRFRRLDERRAAMLASLDGAGRGDDVRQLVEIMAMPFAEGLDGSGGHWVRFVAHLHSDPRFNPFAAGDGATTTPYAAPADAIAATVEVTRRIRAALDLPPEVVAARSYLMTTMVVHAVADREALLAAGVGDALPPTDAFLTQLVDGATALMTGVSPS